MNLEFRHSEDVVGKSVMAQKENYECMHVPLSVLPSKIHIIQLLPSL